MKKNSAFILLTATALSACGGGSSSNTTPVFSQSNYQISTNEDQSASMTVSATDNNSKDTVTYSLGNASANANVDINGSTGEITYQPHDNFNGQDSFEVSASDGSGAVSVTVNVTVAAVNDLPELPDNEILVSGGESKKGMIQATDVDGDILSYHVTATTKNGELSVDPTSGEVTYTPTNLIDVNDSFTVLVSDNNGGELTKELTIKSSLASNADRAYYYYASEHSHLKQAEQHVQSLNNDINQGVVYQNLAVGYAQSGLTVQVERLLAEDSIIRDETRALALLQVANVYNDLDFLEKADAYRTQANTLYTQYVAAKGITAFNQADAGFFTSLSESYKEVGDTDKAEQVLSILDVLFGAALEGDADTAALLTFFGYRNLVDEVIADWQESRSQSDYDLASSMVNRMYSYANMIGHGYVSNDRNGNEGKAYHSIRQVALTDVVNSFIDINEFDNAKEVLHDILALYGVVGIDANYPRTANQYAEVTKVEYNFSLYDMAGPLVTLYPDNDLALYLAGFPEGSFWASLAEQDAEDARLMAQVLNMEDKDAALALVNNAKDPNDLRNHFTNLVSYNARTPGAAVLLKNQGEYNAAANFLAEALTLVSSDDYISENLRIELFVTGTSGCEKIVRELLDLQKITGNDDYRTQAQSSIETCINMAQTYYIDGVDGQDVEISDAIKANSEFIVHASSLDIDEEITASLAITENNLARIEENAYSDRISNLKNIAMSLAKANRFTTAQSYYNRAIEQLNLLEATQIIEEVGDETSKFFSEERSSSSYNNYLSVIESNAGKMDNYAQIKATAYNAWQTIISSRVTLLEEGANQQKLTYLPSYAEQYTRLGKYNDAITLANSEALGVVEKDSIITFVASSLSVKDDFNATLVASVDTDGDGKANFFLESVSDDVIASSGIGLDEDSDNDGVNDESDAYPLDPEQQ
jgi:hypothetical protein